ncbi:hypothetical protein, partial [Mangrovicoccus algicola]
MKTTDPLFPKPAATRPGTTEKLALCALVCWLAAGLALRAYAPEAIGWPGIAVPLVLLGLLWQQARALRHMRQEAATLRDALAAMGAERRQDARAARAAPVPQQVP